jgi:hypothetical protein
VSTDGLGLLVIMFFFGLAGGIVGRIKGGSFVMWFFVSFSIPFFGLLTAVFYRYDNQELLRSCPDCGTLLKLYDAVCMHCGCELEFPDTAISPQARIVRQPAAH